MVINELNIYNEHHYQIENFAHLANQILNAVSIKFNNKTLWSVAVILINEAKSLELNLTYRQKNAIADVLSFDNNHPNDLSNFNSDSLDLGDIYICYPQAKSQAQEYQHSLMRELSFLFLHGLLHILGYDHQTLDEEKIMFALQNEILNQLQILRKEKSYD